LVFFQWHGDVVAEGGGLIISKLIDWKKQKKKPISQVLQLQLNFSCFCFAFFGFLVFFFKNLAYFGNGSDFFSFLLLISALIKEAITTLT
jgi:hypothetical protein